MKWYYFTFRSVTAAQRGEGVLRKMGVTCFLLRTPKWMETKGCGYCLRIRQRDWKRCLEVLEQQAVPFSGIYLQEEDGSITEVRRDLLG